MRRDAQALTSIRARMIRDYWRSHPFIPLWAEARSVSKMPAQHCVPITAEAKHLQKTCTRKFLGKCVDWESSFKGEKKKRWGV